MAALLSVDIGAAVREHARRNAQDEADDTDDTGVRGSTAGAGPVAEGSRPDESPTPPRHPRSRWRVVVSFGVLAALLLSGVALTYVGTRLIRSSTQGEVFTPVEDPTAPGFEALVDPTPTLVMLHDEGGILDSITVLTLPDPDGSGGGVLFVPDRTVDELPAFGDIPIEAAYDLGDADFAARAVGALLGAAMNEVEVVDDGRWAGLVAPVAPITIDNPNELVVDGEIRFPLGEISLEADDVGVYLGTEDADGSDLARLARHEIFWQAWLEAVADAGVPDAVPGELESGIGRFVRTLAGGSTVIETVPVEPVGDDRYGTLPAFFPLEDQIEDLVSRLVPFPGSPSPGARARLRLQNGTPDTSLARAVAADLPPAGVEVVLIGNSVRLDHETTTVRYAGDEYRDEALAVVEILGVGDVVEESRPSDAADITVTLGSDYG